MAIFDGIALTITLDAPTAGARRVLLLALDRETISFPLRSDPDALPGLESPGSPGNPNGTARGRY